MVRKKKFKGQYKAQKRGNPHITGANNVVQKPWKSIPSKKKP